MPLRIRLTRGGAKKNPHYRVVVADGRSPRDGRFLERVGTYHPLLAKDDPERVKLDVDRIKYWLERGAQPSDRVSRFLDAADVAPLPKRLVAAKNRPVPVKEEPAAEDAGADEPAAAEAAAEADGGEAEEASAES